MSLTQAGGEKTSKQCFRKSAAILPFGRFAAGRAKAVQDPEIPEGHKKDASGISPARDSG